MLDLTKLSPAPWIVERHYSNGCEIVPRIHCEKSKDRECGWVADCVGAPYLDTPPPVTQEQRDRFAAWKRYVAGESDVDPWEPICCDQQNGVEFVQGDLFRPLTPMETQKWPKES